MEKQNMLEKSRVLHQLIQRATLDAIEIEYTAQRLQVTDFMMAGETLRKLYVSIHLPRHRFGSVHVL